MTDHDDPIGKIIRQAMDEGKFDNLRGAGQPFPKEVENPFADPSDWAASRILKSAGFSLPWIEERKDIQEAIITARASLIRSWRYYRDAPEAGLPRSRWQQALAAFRERMGEANRLILSFNLKVPVAELHLVALDIEGEIEQVIGS